MAKHESMHQPSNSHETQDPGEGGNADLTEKLESYLRELDVCSKAVQKAMRSCKFNDAQCGYLAEKLEVVLGRARLYLHGDDRSSGDACSSGDGHGGYPGHQSKVVAQSANSHSQHLACSPGDPAKRVEIFKVLLTLGKQIEIFVQRCCKDEWIQSAMTLTNMSEHVSSLGFNLELCQIAISTLFGGESKSLKVEELDNMNKTEAAIVKLRARSDFDMLFESVKKERDSSIGDKEILGSILLRILEGKEISESSASGQGFWRKLLKYLMEPKQVGRGAFSTVYKATWLGIPVAEKTFSVPAMNPVILKEVEIIRQLRHPNIMSMFCFAKEEKTCSIIMELMDEDLGNLIDERRRMNSPFPILEAVDIMLQIGEGVNYLHDGPKIVHRGLKPLNILVNRFKVKSKTESKVVCVPHLKVADFGISKGNQRAWTNSEQTYNTGTCEYMAPE